VDRRIELDRPQGAVSDAERAPGWVLQFADAGRRFDVQPRAIEPLGLPALIFGRFAIADGLADFRIAGDGSLYRILQFDGVRSRGDEGGGGEAGHAGEEYSGLTHVIFPFPPFRRPTKATAAGKACFYWYCVSNRFYSPIKPS